MLAAGLGALLQAADIASEFGAECAHVLLARTQALADRVEHGYHDAADRGDLAIGRATVEVSQHVNRIADSAAAWVDHTIVRRLTESMSPYLIEEFVPEVIDGIMPTIRSRVIPAVIEDLTNDERVRTMVAQQSQDTLAWSVSAVRRGCAEGDNRVESALHRVLSRHDTRT